MDQELKTYLSGMEERTAKQLRESEQRIAGGLRESEQRIAVELRESEQRFAGELRESEQRIAGELRESEQRFAGELRAMEARSVDGLQKLEERTAQLIAGELGGLHTEIQGAEKRLSARFESIDARLKLQAGLIQSGARAMARFSEFSENSEARWVALLSRVEALERKLSGGGHGNGSGNTH